MDFALSEEHSILRDAVRGWARERLAPVAAQLDAEERFPTEMLREMAELGLMGMYVPEEYGGSEMGCVALALALMEVSGACASTAITAGVTNMCAESILIHGNEAQRKKYLPPICDGTFSAAAFSLSEPGSGSDAAALTTTATRDGDCYVLDGTKVFVTSGKHAGVTIVLARTSKESKAGGVSAFLVEPDTPGYTVPRKEEKTGLRASETCVVTLDACKVPVANRLGGEGEGFKVAMRALDSGRIGVGAQATGLGKAALAEAARYAQDRKQFGKPLGALQAIQWKLADAATELEAAEWMVLRAAWCKDTKKPAFTREAAMAKVFATEAAFRACDEALQVHGGYGYTREYTVERLARDVRVTRIYEGTSEIQRVVIARTLLGR